VGRGPQVPGEREDSDGRRRRGWGRQLEQASEAADTQHLGDQGGFTRRIDAGVAIALDQAEERVDPAHAGPGQVARQERPGELPDGLAMPLGPAGQALDIAQGVGRPLGGTVGGRTPGRPAASEDGSSRTPRRRRSGPSCGRPGPGASCRRTGWAASTGPVRPGHVDRGPPSGRTRAGRRRAPMSARWPLESGSWPCSIRYRPEPRNAPSRQIRKVVSEAIDAVRRRKRRASA
jgi:hypothetical protein